MTTEAADAEECGEAVEESAESFVVHLGLPGGGGLIWMNRCFSLRITMWLRSDGRGVKKAAITLLCSWERGRQVYGCVTVATA
jgi:hypothetical protein